MIARYPVVRRLSGRSPATEVCLSRAPDGRACVLEIAPRLITLAAPAPADLAAEAARCAVLDHPALARPIALFAREGRIAGAFDHGGGTSLAELRARQGRFGVAATGYIGCQIAGALAEAHTALDAGGDLTPILHGRLRADVVFAGGDGDVRVAGLGMLAFAGAGGLPGDGVAPEQRQGGRVTMRADVFALAALMRSLLGGPDARVPPDLAAALATAAEPSPERRRITCAELEEWFGRLVDLKAGRRELDEALRAAERDGRPLSGPARAGVALATAAVVTAAGVMIAERRPRASITLPPPASISTAPTAISTASPPLPAAVSAASAASPALPAAEAAPALAHSMPDPARLPPGYGYLTVIAPADARVYVNGAVAGVAGEPVKTRCGGRFVRAGVPREGGSPSWVSAGQSVEIACGAVTTVDLGPRR